MGCAGKLSSADRILKLLFLLLQSSANVSILVMVMISCSLEKGNASEAHYHTLPLTSMLPPLVCNPTTSKGPGRKASMKVVHRFGPCSARGGDSPTMTEILLLDQSRVESIQARLRSISLGKNNLNSESVDLPAVNPNPGGVGNYIVTVGLGTPAKDVELAFDTGSHLTWTQCEPCAVECYQQRLPRFNPAASTTYSNLNCNSQACSQLEAATNLPGQCEDSTATCSYQTSYLDGSHSIGELATDRLTLTSTDVVDGFIFGCGQNNSLISGVEYGGLMGLGTASLSIVSQTSQQFGNYFSYCLPTPTGSDGHLTFGKNSANANNLNYTPFLKDKVGYYYIEILGISVNGQPLSISPEVFQIPGTIIDSGTVITRLPTPAYTALRDAFKQHMTMYPEVVLQQPQLKKLFDTCYDFTNYPNPTIPDISFTFGGNLEVHLDPRGVMAPLNNGGSAVCLAFSYSTDGGIFGNYQQQTFDVVYDVAGGQLGFASGGCS
ncbi:PREDICTED: aspartyl protease family protein At5g10770-like [Ipomoea nil]|uniref:aspartyl protease family protein At5g10770-like n=1 Tax=Ipomoea nil TaxID=35883 RepID=UPI0009013095|nr:PREDICTED: aspartyl protease family protein At5g10770-like [Ipomoea nil]XP_019180469.1 PREDICTED: aspartyl protease family protein At5g10770-like [Ipomoea nil]